MADLVCGDNGSTGSEVVSAVNANTNGLIALSDAVTLLTQRVTTLENTEGVNFVANVDILNVGDAFIPVAKVEVTDMAAGKYLVGFSTTHTFDTTTKSVVHQMTYNNGTAEEFWRENKDTTDRDITSYSFVMEHTSGDFSLDIQMRKEDTSGTLDVQFANVWAIRVG